MYSGREQISEAWGMEGDGKVGQEKERSQKDTNLLGNEYVC